MISLAVANAAVVGWKGIFFINGPATSVPVRIWFATDLTGVVELLDLWEMINSLTARLISELAYI